MAISKTIKVRIIGWQKEKDKILTFLQKTGVVEIEKSRHSASTEKNSSIEYNLAGVTFGINFLNQFSDEKKSFFGKIFINKARVSEGRFKEFIKNYPYQEIIAKTQRIEEDFNEVKRKIKELEIQNETLEAWQYLEDNPEEKETDNTKLVFGVISEKNYIILVQKLNKDKISNIHKINKIDKKIYLEIVFDKQKEEAFNLLFDRVKLEKITLPKAGIPPQKAIIENKKEIKELKNLDKSIRSEAKDLAKEIKNLRIIFDYLTIKKEQIENEQKLGKTDSTFILDGWLEERLLPIIVSGIAKITQNVSIRKLKIKKDEDRPVVIHNKAFLRPFESVTNVYGLPKHEEIDPTPILAPFFIIFFAFCLTDAGYGLIIALLSFLGIKIFKIPPQNQRLIKLLGYGGVITFFIGALFGGWFGIVLENLPGFIAKPLIAIRLIDPVKSPLLVLLMTLVMGIIQIWSGILVSFYWKIKKKKIKDAVLEEGIWLYFIPAVCIFGLSKINVITENYKIFANILLYIGIAAVVLTGGREQKNFFLKIGLGIMKLYSLVGYLSDVLSYSRLLALGLATGIIAMVINLIAGIAMHSIPYLGPIVAILVLIGGHTFNIAINVLGAFIHSSRLQFVEFFPKFMSGGGRRLRPFKEETKFIDFT